MDVGSIHPTTKSKMGEIQWGPWNGMLRGSPNGFPATSTHSAWKLPTCDLEVLQKTMLSMLKDSALSDVCLVVEDVEVPSHKAVLAAWSRPFRAMFTLPMAESRHQCRVVIEDAEHKHIMVVLHYLYAGRIDLDDQNVIPVSALANRYEVLPLVAQCEDFMKKRLNPSNVCQQLLAAEEHSVPKAAAFALEFLAVHFDEVYHASSGDFNYLDGDTVLRVLQHSGLTADEETVFLAVDGWAKDWKRRRAVRGAPSYLSVGRSPRPPPAVPAPPAQTLGATKSSSSSSSTPQGSAETMVNEAEPPCHGEKRLPGGEQEMTWQRGDVGSGAETTEHDRLEQRGEIATTSCAERDGPSMTPSSMEATTGLPTSAAKGTEGMEAAREAAAVRSRAEEERQATQQQPLVTSAPSPSDRESAAISTSTCGTHAEEDYPDSRSTTVSSSSSDFTRSASPTLTARDVPGGTSSRSSAEGAEHLSSVGLGKGSREEGAQGAAQDVVQSRISKSGGGTGTRSRRVRHVLGRAASLPTSLPRPEGSAGTGKKDAAAVFAHDGTAITIGPVVGAGPEALEGMKGMVYMPEEERDVVDELLTEVRFPLISTSFLCQVVEKSLAVLGSRVAQKLLHEAYRFQAMTSADAVDVDEHFPGNHRVKYRGHEQVLFGEGDGCVGTVGDFSSSLSEVHVVDNVKRKDEKYWLPGQPEEAYFCVRLDRVRRITKVRFQNRYSEEFEVAVRRSMKEEWQVIVPRRVSGGHKNIQEINLTRKRVKARHVKISLRGRKSSCYNTSCYWTELLGF